MLRIITPQDTCRKLSVYPVRLTQEAIEVDISSQVHAPCSKLSLALLAGSKGCCRPHPCKAFSCCSCSRCIPQQVPHLLTAPGARCM